MLRQHDRQAGSVPQNSTFVNNHWSSSVEFTVTGSTTIHIGFGVQAAKTPTYPVMHRFPLFVTLCDHNPPTPQTNRLTDVMLAAKNWRISLEQVILWVLLLAHSD